MPQYDILLCSHWAFVTKAHRAYIDLKPTRSKQLDVDTKVKRPIQQTLEQKLGHAVPVPTFWIGADKWRSALHVKPGSMKTFAIGKRLNRCYTVYEATDACIIDENIRNGKGEKRSDPLDLIPPSALPRSLSSPFARPDFSPASFDDAALDLMDIASNMDETEGTILVESGSMEASDSNSDHPDILPVPLDDEPSGLMDIDMPLIDSYQDWLEMMRAGTVHEDADSAKRSSIVRSVISLSVFRQRSIGTWSAGSRNFEEGDHCSATVGTWLRSAGRAAEYTTGWTFRPEEDGKVFVAMRVLPGFWASTRVDLKAPVRDVFSSAVANFSTPNPGTSLQVDQLLSPVSD